MKTTETIRTTETTETTGTTETNTKTTKTIEKHFFYTKMGIYFLGGIPSILGGFIALGIATGVILWIANSSICWKILLGTGLAGLGVGLLVAGFFLLGMYRRHDEHFLNNQ
jgi:hypothetical protein